MTLEFGLFDAMQTPPGTREPAATTLAHRLDDLAYADRLGYAIAFTAEYHFLPRYLCAAPSVWVAAASQRTSRMRLGVLAYSLPLHHPVTLAEEIALLDQLSGGRMEVGVGLGRRPEELIANGIDPDQRIRVFQERLAMLEGLWTGKALSVTAQSVTLNDLAIHPLPIQSPSPPLWFDGTDATAATWAGSHGLNLAVGFAPLRDLVPFVAGFRGARLARGDRGPGGRVALIQHVYVAESDVAAEQELLADLARIAELDPAAANQSPEERTARAAAELRRLRDRELILTGSADTVADGIAFARKALGIDRYLANVWMPGIERERVHRSLRLLAEEVRPRVLAAPVTNELDVTTTR